jgi:type IV pilus assembly protein PilW
MLPDPWSMFMMYPNKFYRCTHQQQGFSLVELMIGLVLGLFVIGVIVTVFVQSKRNFNQDQQIAQMQENGRYALQLLSREVAHAGFLGGMSAVDTIDASGLTYSCADWFNPLVKPIEIFDAGTPANCFGLGEAAGTQVMVIKRTDGKSSAAAAANKLYFRTRGQGGKIINTGTSSGATPAGWVDWEYLPEIYYIKDDDSNADGVSIPALYRKRMIVSGGNITLTDEELLAPGINNFGLLYGFDSGEDDGVADDYVISSDYSDTLNKVVSARVSVLAMSTDNDPNYENNKKYTLYPSVEGPDYVTGLSAAANGPNYYGRVFSTTAQIRNNAYRIQIYSVAQQK